MMVEGYLDEEQLARALALERCQVVYRHLPFAFGIERNLVHLLFVHGCVSGQSEGVLVGDRLRSHIE